MEKKETAIFAAGCFWGVEETFRRLPGVLKTEAGYIGGSLKKPTYEDVCSGATGHAEAVRIEFDSRRIPYQILLDIFWKAHDPTQLNRQGPDVGDQYRSAIFFESPEQELAAQNSKAALEKSGKWQRPIVTQILPAPAFWPAEDYHQQYLAKRGLGQCHL